MLEKLERIIDKENLFEVLLTDLSQTFDSFSEELIIAKLYD